MKKVTSIEKLPVSVSSKSPMLQVVEAPDLDSRPMARMWFPDAGAGAEERHVRPHDEQRIFLTAFAAIELTESDLDV